MKLILSNKRQFMSFFYLLAFSLDVSCNLTFKCGKFVIEIFWSDEVTDRRGYLVLELFS